MQNPLNRNLFVIKEHVGLFKAANNYDVFDAQTGEVVLHCREERLGFFTKLLRFTDYKRMTPFHIDIRTPEGNQVLSVRRGSVLLRSHVTVKDSQDRHIGGFRQKLLSIGGAFRVMDQHDEELCLLKGTWTSWEFDFIAGETVLAKVRKKWSGLGKEIFTTADNYVLEISETVPPDHPVRQLIMAAVFCIDMVLKE